MTTAETVRGGPDDFLSIIRRQQLGKLKIYLGACPGVGKTYQMLIEGNRLRKQGVDVVIGYVEPHERPETTAQIGELEIVPPLVTKYHGITLKEMDLDAVLGRKPTIALVDELAHTNAPQSRNRKRYEDVQDLLRAGINVIATVNIQHFESLYNIIEQATGVKVKERVPDEIVAQADQIVNIDLPAEDL
ncbi:MAG: histidine kinase, partial [Verrucomicrobia bacterium]|nr:histidine kinase [Verrucomicrobiota bacterium]